MHKTNTFRKLISKANQSQNPLSCIPSVNKTLARTNVQANCSVLYELESYRARDMPRQLLEWCMQLCKSNMQTLYEQVWGWSDTTKKKQLEAVG